MKIITALVLFMTSSICFAGSPLKQCREECDQKYNQCAAPVIVDMTAIVSIPAVPKSVTMRLQQQIQQCVDNRAKCLETECSTEKFPPLCAYANSAVQCARCCRILSDQKYVHMFDNVIDFEQCSSYCKP